MLKKSKLLLAFMPFMLASCGGNNDCVASRDASYKYCTKYDGGGSAYKVMGFNLSLVDDKTVNVSGKDFSVEIDGNKIAANCLVNAYMSGSTWYYDNVLESKTVTGETKSTSVYAAWTTDVAVESATNFYCKNQLVTTSAVIIKI